MLLGCSSAPLPACLSAPTTSLLVCLEGAYARYAWLMGFALVTPELSASSGQRRIDRVKLAGGAGRAGHSEDRVEPPDARQPFV